MDRIITSLDNLCLDLSLSWDTNFKLLGVEFDKDLENMDSNFAIKLDEMKKVIDWKNNCNKVTNTFKS